jgi:RNA polymerase sigma factor for flagellar operon FliA
MAGIGINRLKKYRQALPPLNNGLNAVDRDTLISRYAPLVKTIAGRLAMRLPQHINQDDLTSAGLVGLLDAIEKFDAEKGVEFKSYAEFRIKGAMIDELRSMDWVPRSVRRNAKKLEEAYSRVENREMRPAMDQEVAKELDLDMESFHRLLDDAKGISIINEYEIINHNGNLLSNGRDQSPHPGVNVTPSETLDRAEIINVISGAIEKLPKNERTVISLYYYEELTMKEIGEVMGYTESRVSQLHTKAAIRLRNCLKEYFDR